MSQFSKSDYVWLASFFRDEAQRAKQSSREAEVTIEFCIHNLAHEMQIDNSQFDKQLFIKNIYNDPTNHKPQNNNPVYPSFTDQYGKV